MQLCICTCTVVLVMMLECKSRLVAFFFGPPYRTHLQSLDTSRQNSHLHLQWLYSRRGGVSPLPHWPPIIIIVLLSVFKVSRAIPFCF